MQERSRGGEQLYMHTQKDQDWEGEQNDVRWKGEESQKAYVCWQRSHRRVEASVTADQSSEGKKQLGRGKDIECRTMNAHLAGVSACSMRPAYLDYPSPWGLSTSCLLCRIGLPQRHCTSTLDRRVPTRFPTSTSTSVLCYRPRQRKRAASSVVVVDVLSCCLGNRHDRVDAAEVSVALSTSGHRQG